MKIMCTPIVICNSMQDNHILSSSVLLLVILDAVEHATVDVIKSSDIIIRSLDTNT